MYALYAHCHITKQAHYQALQQQRHLAELEELVLNLVLEVRRMHPAMGLRTIYQLVQPDSLGRDSFVRIGMQHGLGALNPRRASRTTFASPFRRYPNLLHGLVLTNINQLWTSDITYFEMAGQFYYIVFILDVYSRRIVGYSVADHMRADRNVEALQMAFSLRRQSQYTQGLIHHSDRGSQYIATPYVSALNGAGIRISMCSEVYENSHIERVNGTIKNQYLHYWQSTTLEELSGNLRRAVRAYNEQRPHSSLGGISPSQFEACLRSTQADKYPKMAIWTYKESKGADPLQGKLPF